jgi:hypothetical protein
MVPFISRLNSMLIYVLTRFLLPLGFAAVGVSWSLSGEWTQFLSSQTGAFSSHRITNACFRGAFLFGAPGVAVGISLEEYLRRQTTQAQAKARSRLIAQLRTLTGSNLPDDTRAAISLLLEDLNDVS